jgi:hypothetical protein
MRGPLHGLCLGAALLMTSGLAAVVTTGPFVLEPELQPGYLRWVRSPGEMVGFWFTPDPAEAQSRTGANARSMHRMMQVAQDTDGSTHPVIINDCEPKTDATQGTDTMCFGLGLGEHNNPFFVRYPGFFTKGFPQSFMWGASGTMICRGPGAPESDFAPVPAVDDPVISALACEQIGAGARCYSRESGLRYYVIGGEQAYPEYFGWERGDFRPAALEHLAMYCRAMRRQAPLRRADGSTTLARDLAFEQECVLREFKEAAIGERAARYLQAFLGADASRPVLYPTHGNPFLTDSRTALGHVPGLLAASCDGFETGQISIDADGEDLNLMMLSHLTAHGKPVVSPRLGNKQLDGGARGGGRSFSPAMLRRAVYEAVGMGVWHIGLVQWMGDLADGEWHIKDTPAEAEAGRVFGELRAAAPYLLGMSRLQPRVALYVSDAQWRRGWNPRWTGFFQDALAAGWNITMVGDSMLSRQLSRRIPLLVAIDDESVAVSAARAMREYLDGGGHLIRSGRFGTTDELGASSPEGRRLRHGSCVSAAERFGPERLLRSCTSTNSGAYEERRPYRPVSFDAIAGIAGRLVRPADLCPVALDVQPQGSVRVFPLTDGQTIAAVLVNMSEQIQSVGVTAAPGMDWEVTVLPSAGSKDSASQSSDSRSQTQGPKPVRAELCPRGTAILWWYERGLSQPTVDEARAAVSHWRDAGADVGAFDALLSSTTGLSSAEHEPKRTAIVRGVLGALAVSATARESSDGVLHVSAEVIDSGGRAVESADVQATLVPGDGRAVTLHRKGDCYVAQIAFDERPLSFDVQGGRYVRLSGPVRLTVSARAGERCGMGMFVLSLEAH